MMAARRVSNVWRCSDCAVGSVTRNVIQRRSFTASTACQKLHSVPTFNESATNPELNDMISTLRDKLFVPALLPKGYRSLVYGNKSKESLANDPVTVEIAGEEFALQHIDRTKDLPNNSKALFNIVDQFKTPSDWANLPSLLAGLKSAGWVLTESRAEKLVRKAGLAGRADAIIQCARQASTTGFYLTQDKVVILIMWGLSRQAALSNWDEAITLKSLQKAEQTAYLLEEKIHAGGNVLHKGDPRVRPEVVGILLQLAAVRASKHLGGKDVDGKVALYAERLRGVLSNGLMMDENPDLHSRNQLLTRLAPIIQGLRLSEKIISSKSELGKWLRQRDTGIPELAASERELLLKEGNPDHKYLGLEAYKTYIEA